MFAQTMLMCAALVGQCGIGGGYGGCGPGPVIYSRSMYGGVMYGGPVMYSRSVYGEVYRSVPNGSLSVVYRNSSDCAPSSDQPENSSLLKTSAGKRAVMCYYRNKGTVSRKAYAKARVYLGGPEDLINVPIINGCAPSLLVTRNDSGKIVSMICDYEKKLEYVGGTLIYGKPVLGCQPPADGDKPVKDIEPVPVPIPSQETHPTPRGEEAPPESNPLPAEIPGMSNFPGVKATIEPPAPKEGETQPQEKLVPVPSK